MGSMGSGSSSLQNPFPPSVPVPRHPCWGVGVIAAVWSSAMGALLPPMGGLEEQHTRTLPRLAKEP